MLKKIDARGWIAIGVYLLVVFVLVLLASFAKLRSDEYFKTISTLIVGAFIKDVVGWAFQATKGGGELAERNAAIVEGHANAPSVPAQPVTGAVEAATEVADAASDKAAEIAGGKA